MNDAARLIDALKTIARMRGKTYAQLADHVGLSEASVKRLFSERSFSVARLAQFCEALEIDFAELVRAARGREGDATTMTLEQESALASDVRLLSVFYLVVNGWTLDEIVARYQITSTQCVGALAALDRLKLIDLLPGNRIRPRIRRNTRLRPDGPIRRLHGKRAVDNFLSPSFDRVGGWFTFEFSELSKASFEILKRKLERLADEFQELAELDGRIAPDRRETIGMALGLRPWSMEVAIELPVRKRPVRAR
ncbi:MAG TPA: helix-turn-helix transcriptional regulator [Casimicrobiaceae bacterium]|nr:helix-turn-helix transcriptional regulator [Casimicrobiaceae bacterium]